MLGLGGAGLNYIMSGRIKSLEYVSITIQYLLQLSQMQEIGFPTI